MSRNSENVKNWRKRIKEAIILSMGGCCQICRYSKCQNALELHHLNPEEKEFSMSFIRSSPKEIKIICEELNKCVLLCSNCHKEIHANLTTLPETFSTFNEELFNEIRMRLCSKINRNKNVVKYLDKSDEEVYNLYIQHGSYSKVGILLDVSETTILRRVKRYLLSS